MENPFPLAVRHGNTSTGSCTARAIPRLVLLLPEPVGVDRALGMVRTTYRIIPFFTLREQCCELMQTSRV